MEFKYVCVALFASVYWDFVTRMANELSAKLIIQQLQ